MNHRVMLELPTVHGDVVRIPAKAKWSADGESGHRVGCEFVSHDGCTTLYAAVGEEEPVCETRPLDTRVWTWLALLFLLLWFGAQSVLLLIGRSLIDLGGLRLW